MRLLIEIVDQPRLPIDADEFPFEGARDKARQGSKNASRNFVRPVYFVRDRDSFTPAIGTEDYIFSQQKEQFG